MVACQSVSFMLAHPIEERLKFAKHLQGEMFLLKGKMQEREEGKMDGMEKGKNNIKKEG